MKTINLYQAIVLYGILAGAWLSVAVLAVLYFPVILLFGMDAPDTPIPVYLFSLSIPPLAVALMSGACWGVHWLWRSRRQRVFAFVCAGSLGVIGWWVANHFRPH